MPHKKRKHDQGAEGREEAGNALQTPKPARLESSTPKQEPQNQTTAKFSTATRSTSIPFRSTTIVFCLKEK